MISAEKVAAVLGMSKIHSLNDLRVRVSAGLPVKTLEHTLKHVSRDAAGQKALRDMIIAASSLKRRTRVLSLVESERVERVARVYATALDVWSDEDDAREFMFHSHPLLDGERPIDLAVSELGARQVEDMLLSLKYGLPV
jgi:putative toxin-antitoxin system antitoxin component (TIGR02293 family)